MGKKKDKDKDRKDKAGISRKLKTKEKKSKQTKKQKKAAIQPPLVSPQQRIDMIAEAAYFIAEKNGFDPSRSGQDWQEAVRQIDDMLNPEQDTDG